MVLVSPKPVIRCFVGPCINEVLFQFINSEIDEFGFCGEIGAHKANMIDIDIINVSCKCVHDNHSIYVFLPPAKGAM